MNGRAPDFLRHESSDDPSGSSSSGNKSSHPLDNNPSDESESDAHEYPPLIQLPDLEELWDREDEEDDYEPMYDHLDFEPRTSSPVAASTPSNSSQIFENSSTPPSPSPVPSGSDASQTTPGVLYEYHPWVTGTLSLVQVVPLLLR